MLSKIGELLLRRATAEADQIKTACASFALHVLRLTLRAASRYRRHVTLSVKYQHDCECHLHPPIIITDALISQFSFTQCWRMQMFYHYTSHTNIRGIKKDGKINPGSHIVAICGG